MMLLFIVPVACPTQSSSIVMVITEVAQIVQLVEIQIFAPFGVVVYQTVHIFLVEEYVSDPEEERVVENSVHGTNVPCYVVHIPVKDFSY